jgi:chromate reductase
MKLTGISGSIREKSYNTMLLHAAAGCLPEVVTMSVIDCGDIPLYNGDHDGEVKPPAVAKLLQTIGESDGLLFATPEYNYSIPGVLKNAIDWASRPGYKSVLARKPAAIVSAAKSVVGGARVQLHLRDVFSATLTPVVPSPPFLLPLAQDKFDKEGRLVDEESLNRLDRYVKDFVEWVKLLTVAGK